MMTIHGLGLICFVFAFSIYWQPSTCDRANIQKEQQEPFFYKLVCNSQSCTMFSRQQNTYEQDRVRKEKALRIRCTSDDCDKAYVLTAFSMDSFVFEASGFIYICNLSEDKHFVCEQVVGSRPHTLLEFLLKNSLFGEDPNAEKHNAETDQSANNKPEEVLYDDEHADAKRMLPYDTLNFGKRPMPFDTLNFGKRPMPFDTLNFGKRQPQLPFVGYIMGRELDDKK